MDGKKTAMVGVSVLLSLIRVSAESKTTFLSTCFSNVCIGDDIDKVIESQQQWVTLHLIVHDKDQARQEDQRVFHLPETSQFLKKHADVLSTAFQNLSKEDLEALGSMFFDVSYTAKPTPYGRLIDLMLKERVSFLVVDSAVLSILSKVPVCGALPVHGVFVSESGLYTSVLMMPVNGKLTVVQMRRLFNLHIPDDVTEAQRDHTLFDQVATLAKQIDTKYGTQWATSESGTVLNQNRAESDTIAAYLRFHEVWRGGHKDVEPVMTLCHRDFDTATLQRSKQFVDEALAASKTCEVKTP